MLQTQHAPRPRAHPPLSLVEQPAADPPVILHRGAQTVDDRMSLAALQATAAELQTLAAATRDAAGAMLDAAPSVADAAIEAALRTIPRWHFAMLNDRARNDMFALAVRRRVRPGMRVLDIGSGTGLLAMMAVNAGAAHVTTCEANPLLAELSRQVIAAHGMADEITVVAKRSTGLVVGDDLAGPVDLVISEIVDCGLVGEGLLPTMRHAREHLLAPGGALLPARGRIIGSLVQSGDIAKLNRVTDAAGYDVRLLNHLATPGHFPVRLTTWRHRLLSEPASLAEFDLRHGSLDDAATPVTLQARADGCVHGLVVWFEFDLGAGVVVSNAPTVTDSHWMQAFIPWNEGARVQAGEQIAFDLAWRQGRLTTRDRAATTNAEA